MRVCSWRPREPRLLPAIATEHSSAPLARRAFLPGLADAELLARHLEYRLRGVGSADEARSTVAALSHLEGKLSPEQAELRSFLLAEAEDRVEGAGDPGLSELEREIALHGPRPLLSMGRAERLSALGRARESLEDFDLALSGELYGLRSRASRRLARR